MRRALKRLDGCPISWRTSPSLTRLAEGLIFYEGLNNRGAFRFPARHLVCVTGPEDSVAQRCGTWLRLLRDGLHGLAAGPHLKSSDGSVRPRQLASKNAVMREAPVYIPVVLETFVEAATICGLGFYGLEIKGAPNISL